MSLEIEVQVEVENLKHAEKSGLLCACSRHDPVLAKLYADAQLLLDLYRHHEVITSYKIKNIYNETVRCISTEHQKS